MCKKSWTSWQSNQHCVNIRETEKGKKNEGRKRELLRGKAHMEGGTEWETTALLNRRK